jgi:hypothetical protein
MFGCTCFEEKKFGEGFFGQVKMTVENRDYDTK